MNRYEEPSERACGQQSGRDRNSSTRSKAKFGKLTCEMHLQGGPVLLAAGHCVIGGWAVDLRRYGQVLSSRARKQKERGNILTDLVWNAIRTESGWEVLESALFLRGSTPR